MATAVKLQQRHVRLLANYCFPSNSHNYTNIRTNRHFHTSKLYFQQSEFDLNSKSSKYQEIKIKWATSKKDIPRFYWIKDTPSPEEVNFGLTEENELHFNNKSLSLPYASTSPLVHEPWPRNSWKEKGLTLRTGLLAIKIGVVPQWTVTGKKVLCTMLQVLDNHVIDYRRPVPSIMPDFSKKGKMRQKYGVCIVGAMSESPLNFSEAYNQLFIKSGVPPKRKITNFMVTEDAAVPPGTPLTAQHYRVGDYVDVHAKTMDMGFQGVLTRWGMKGGRASHGVTKAHRRIGSIGGGGDKGGIWKGKKMPGHMGGRFRYHRGLQILRINTKYNVIYVRGGNLPGPPRSYVRILDTLLPHRRSLLSSNPPPMPTFYPEDSVLPDTPENMYHESLFTYDDDFVSYEGLDPNNLNLYTKQYILVGGTKDGKNHSYRRGIL